MNCPNCGADQAWKLGIRLWVCGTVDQSHPTTLCRAIAAEKKVATYQKAWKKLRQYMALGAVSLGEAQESMEALLDNCEPPFPSSNPQQDEQPQ